VSERGSPRAHVHQPWSWTALTAFGLSLYADAAMIAALSLGTGADVTRTSRSLAYVWFGTIPVVVVLAVVGIVRTSTKTRRRGRPLAVWALAIVIVPVVVLSLVAQPVSD
jgi:hypothetical protein